MSEYLSPSISMSFQSENIQNSSKTLFYRVVGQFGMGVYLGRIYFYNQFWVESNFLLFDRVFINLFYKFNGKMEQIQIGLLVTIVKRQKLVLLKMVDKLKSVQNYLQNQPLQIYFITTYTYKQQMGAGKSQENIYQDPTLNAQLFDQTKHCKFYRNQKGEEFEKYRVRNTANNDFQNRYDYRIKHNSPYLVNAFSAKTSQNAFGCTSGDQYQVVTQRIPIRLCDINNLPGPQALNMVHKALKGFQQIYKSQGVILVKDSMIGINKQNNVKVWMNSNYAVNQVEQPPISYGVLSDYEKQSTLVDNIIQLVNSRSKRDHQWVGFVQEKYKQGRIGFDQAIQLSQIQAQRYNVILNNSNSSKLQSHQENSFSSNKYYQIINTQIPNDHHQFNRNFDSNISMMKSTTQAIGAPINSNPQLPALNVFTPQGILNKQMTQPISNIKAQTGISSIRNKIVNKNSQAFEQYSQQLSGIPMISQSPKFPHHLIQGSPIMNSQILSNKNFPNQVLPNNNRNRFPIASASAELLNRPRSYSQGKPFITYGNRTLNPSPQNNMGVNLKKNEGKPIISTQIPPVNQFSNPKNINDAVTQQPSQKISQNNTNSKIIKTSNSNLNSLFVKNQIQDAKNLQSNGQIKFNTQQLSMPRQTPQIKERQKNQLQLQKQIQNDPSKSNQNKRIVRPLIIEGQQSNKNDINRHQIKIQTEQEKIFSQPQQLQSIKVVNKQKVQIAHFGISQSKDKKDQMINYPPPNQVTNFERKIEINDTKPRINPQVIQHSQLIQVNNRTNDLYDSKSKEQEPKIRINQIHSEQSDNQDNKLLKSSVTPLQYSSKDNRQQAHSHSVKRTQTFGAGGSFGFIPHVGAANQEIIQNKDRKYQYFEESPMFGKEKQSKVSEGSSQVIQNKRETHIDQLLALEQEKFYMIKSKQSQGVQKSMAGSMGKKESIKQIKNEGENNKILNQNTIMTNSKKENKKSEQEVPFKKAVKQTASNIRLETSKVSIRSSSDLKGIISYKDLRDLLKSTKRPLN